MFVIVYLLIASFIQTANIGINLGYIFTLIFLWKSLKNLLSFKLYKKPIISTIISIALVINLFSKIIFEAQFRTFSTYIVLLSYISFIITLNFFCSMKLMSKNKSIFYKAVNIFYHRIFYPFLIIEFLTRLLKIQLGLPWFYMLKRSFFYFDSNFLGLYLVLSLLFITIAQDLKYREKHIIIHILFIILSTSRASILSSCLVLLVIKFSSLISNFYPKKVNYFFKKNQLLKVIAVLIATICILQYNNLGQLLIDFIVTNLQGADGSLNTKINLFDNVLQSLFYGETQGLGFGNYRNIYFIWAHSFLNMHLIEGGVLNFLLLFALLCFSFGDSLIGIMILFIILFQGLSVFSYNIIALGIVISTYILADNNQIYVKAKNTQQTRYLNQKELIS